MTRQFTITPPPQAQGDFTPLEPVPAPAWPDLAPRPPADPVPAAGTGYVWTASQIDTMCRSIGHLIDRQAGADAPRYDVATLAVTLGLMPAGVPLLRLALETMADRGEILRDRWADIDHDRTYILGGGTVPPMTHMDFTQALAAMKEGHRVSRAADGSYVLGGPGLSGMDFGQALAAMKAGFRVARDGWVIGGKWVSLRTGYPDGIAVNANTADAFGVPAGTLVVFQPYFQMCERDGSIRTWNKGDQDLIAEDWYVVEGAGNLAAPRG